MENYYPLVGLKLYFLTQYKGPRVNPVEGTYSYSAVILPIFLA